MHFEACWKLTTVANKEKQVSQNGTGVERQINRMASRQTKVISREEVLGKESIYQLDSSTEGLVKETE